MTLENQVTSLELSKKLKELGVKQESLFWWSKWDGSKYPSREYCLWLHGQATTDEANDITYFSEDTDDISAFTVAELGEMLPTEIELESKLTGKKEKKGMGFLTDDIVEQVNDAYGVDKYRLFIIEIGKYQVKEKSEADARAAMIIHLIENKLIDTE